LGRLPSGENNHHRPTEGMWHPRGKEQEVGFERLPEEVKEGAHERLTWLFSF